MTTRKSVCARALHFIPVTFLVLIVGFTSQPSVRAGLTVDIHSYRYPYSFVSYGWLSTNATPPAAPLGDYLISSPNGSHLRYRFDTNGFNFITGGGIGTTDFNAFMNTLTNGQWFIQVTNSSSTNTYFFNVTAAGLSSNLFNPATITFPANNSQNVTNNPTFTWVDGPIGWLGTAEVSVRDEPYNNYYAGTTLPPSATSWSTPNPPLPPGTNLFHLVYLSNLTATVVATIPRDISSNAIAGWISTANLDVNSEDVQFIVGTGMSANTSLFGHYTFDDQFYLEADSSGLGHDAMGVFYTGGSSQFPQYNASGITNGAVEFDGENAFYWGTNMVNVLAGSYTVSLWLKTTQSYGSDGDDGYDGAAIFTGDDSGDFPVPMALTGDKLAFYTADPDHTINSGNSINSGTFKHLVVTRDAATGLKCIYVDGALDVSDPGGTSPGIDSYEVYLGYSYYSGQGIVGVVDDLQVYTGVLNTNQIDYLFNHPGAVAPDTTAGTNPPVDVELEISITRSQDLSYGDSYLCFPRLNSVNITEITEHRVESPNDQFDGSLTGSGSSLLSSLGSVLNECTNGLWKLYINKNDPSEQLFTFTVTITGVDTNLLKAVTVISPANGSSNVSTSPQFTWSGPAGFDGIFLQKYELPFTNSVSTNLPGTATNWPSPPVLNPGTNRFYLSYHTNDVPHITFSTPVDGSSQPINSWITTAHLNSDATVEFVVAVGATPVQLANPNRSGGDFQFQFLSQTGRTNVVQSRTNLNLGMWLDRTNILGDGTLKTIILPVSGAPVEFFRVSTQ